MMEAAIPVGAMNEPEDIAAALAFLASDEARHITGQTLAIDGGVTLGSAAGLPHDQD